MSRYCRISSRCIGYLCYSTTLCFACVVLLALCAFGLYEAIGYLCYGTTLCFACVVLLALCAFGLDEAVLHYAKSGWAEGFGGQNFSLLFWLFRAAAGR